MMAGYWLGWIASFLIVVAILAIGAALQEWLAWRKARRVIVFALMVLSLPHSSAARDDGRYAQSQHKGWFDQLKSKGGALCCSDADGTALSDVDWETRDNHYRVRINDEWIDVPDEAVIIEPNRVGRTMVWPYFADGHPRIRCFMPGSMT